MRDGIVPSLRPSILLCDDDVTFRDRLARAVAERGYDVRIAGHHAEAMAAGPPAPPPPAPVAPRPPGRPGPDLVRDLPAIDPPTRVVVLPGYGSTPPAVAAIRLGAVHYLPKPA